MPRKSALALVEPPEKHAGGRPTKYKPEYVDQVFKLCLLGLTAKQMADVFDVNEDTFFRWRLEHPEFSEAIRNGGEPANANVAASLYKRANGYSYVAEKLLVVDKSVVREQVIEHVPPDVRAQQHWLRNKKVNWIDKLQVTGPDGGPIQQVTLNIHTDPIEAARTYQKLIGGE